jgi:hypothetical protein
LGFECFPVTIRQEEQEKMRQLKYFLFSILAEASLEE